MFQVFVEAGGVCDKTMDTAIAEETYLTKPS